MMNQWIAKNGWSTKEANYVTITNQDESIKTKKITEKIDLESVAGIMASCFQDTILSLFYLVEINGDLCS